MLFDPEAGLYVFEVIVGCEVGGERLSTTPCLIQADDPEEAEEKVLEYLSDLDMDQRFWLEDLSDAYSPEEYQHDLEENDRKPFVVLDELTDEELLELMGL